MLLCFAPQNGPAQEDSTPDRPSSASPLHDLVRAYLQPTSWGSHEESFTRILKHPHATLKSVARAIRQTPRFGKEPVGAQPQRGVVVRDRKAEYALYVPMNYTPERSLSSDSLSPWGRVYGSRVFRSLGAPAKRRLYLGLPDHCEGWVVDPLWRRARVSHHTGCSGALSYRSEPNRTYRHVEWWHWNLDSWNALC